MTPLRNVPSTGDDPHHLPGYPGRITAKLCTSIEPHGMAMALLVSSGIAIVGAALTLLCLPSTNASTEARQGRSDEDLAYGGIRLTGATQASGGHP
jgi:hypothetical protein